jgi:hypothetical protein
MEDPKKSEKTSSITINTDSKIIDDPSHISDSENGPPNQPQNILLPEKPTSNPDVSDIIVIPGCVACTDTSKLRTLHKCTKDGCENLIHTRCSVDMHEFVCPKHQIPTTAPKPPDPPVTVTTNTDNNV